MKTNKLLFGLLGLSVAINIATFFSGSDESETNPASSRDFDQVLIDANNSLFTQDLPSNVVNAELQDDDQIPLLKKKIAVLVKQNQFFQKQIDLSNQKQADILDALNTIVDKIDNQLLMPTATQQTSTTSDYNLDFNSISRDVVNQCMKLTSDASSNIRQQQRQTREQLLQDEEIDGVWSGEIESTVQSMLSERQLQESELVSLNCRTTICQIKVQHGSPSAKKLFETSFFSSFQQDVSQYDESFDKDSNLSTGIFYLSRSNRK